MSDPIQSATRPEPWLRNTLTDIPAVQRAVLHALELAREDLDRWCGDFTSEEINARPADLPSIAFHLRHIARSLDRLLTYAEKQQLDAAQIEALKAEMDAGVRGAELFAELSTALKDSRERVLRFDAAHLEEARIVGRKQLPTSLGGLLVHVADHTQRHVGQAVTTAKILLAERRKRSATD
jgi:uncharacterized damage-inducible protein DinB